MDSVLLRIGWRNLWRNPRRTAITALAIAVGMIMLAFVLSLMAGMKRDLINQGTQLMLGQVQIHKRDYRPDRSIFDTVPLDGRALADQLLDRDDIFGAAPRVSAFGLVSSGDKSLGAEIVGMDRDAESQVTTLGRKLEAGDLPGRGERTIAVGRSLANTLGVSPGSELILLTQAADGSLGNDLYTVSGIFRTGLEMVDGGMVVLDLGVAQELLALEAGRIHEIALRSTSPARAMEVAAAIEQSLGVEDISVAPWQELAPQLAGWVAMSDSWMWIMYLIVFVLAAISVLNTMLMAVFERLREFGVMAAVGMQPRTIITMVLAEVISLALVSLLVATILGAPLVHWITNSGIDLSATTDGISMSGTVVDPVIRGAWAPAEFAVAAGLLVVCAALAGLYPATRAARTDPARLTRGEIR